MNTRFFSAAALAGCAVSELATVPLLLGSDDVAPGIGVGLALSLLTIGLLVRPGQRPMHAAGVR
jgi:hypothetical protein